MPVGVYVIRNKVNGKIYIGSTTKSFVHRWGMHKSELRRGIHKNARLQNAWNKYGERAFIFKIIEECDREKCLNREQYYIDMYHAYNREIGYNINEKARSRIGMRQEVGTSSQIKHRDIYVFKIDGTSIGHYPTTSHAALHLFGNKHKSKMISTCLIGGRKSYKGYIFTFEFTFPGYTTNYVGRGKWSQESKDKVSKTRTGIRRLDNVVKVHQLTKSGELIKTWNSIKDAAEALNTTSTNICYAASGKRLSAANFKWAYIKQPDEYDNN